MMNSLHAQMQPTENSSFFWRGHNLRWVICLIFIIFLLLLFFLGWIPKLVNEKKIDALADNYLLPQVTTMIVTANKNLIPLVLPSSAQAWHITPIWARANGYLIRYLVDIGDVVKTGDLLAELDTPEIDEQVAQAQADLLSSTASRDIAKITSERWQRLLNKNKEAVSKQEVDQNLATYQSAEAIVVANEKNVARLTFQQQFKYIYAPFDGIITKRNIDIGALIYGGVNNTPQELFQIAQTHIMRFFVDVPQTYYRQIKEGLEAEVTIPQISGKIFKGQVSRYAKALDPNARTLLTEIDIENPEKILYTGLYGQVNFLMKPPVTNYIIPTAALIIRSGHPHVARVDQNQIVHLKRVEIGRDYGKNIEIIAGLEENDQIITISSANIQDGVKVEIKEKNSSEK